MTFRAIAALAVLGTPALSDVPRLNWPENSAVTYQDIEPSARHRIATGPYSDTGLPTREVDGERTIEVRRTPYPIEPLAVVDTLKAQLAGLGFVAGFDCDARGCGGFDFRYALDITHEPDMHVDLGRFHYLSLTNPSTGAHLTLLASSSASEGYIELTHIKKPGAPDVSVSAETELVRDVSLPVAQQLGKFGSAALDDLKFASGSATLESNGAGSLGELADFLTTNPDATIILVGHTDTAGSLEANIGLSLRRAASVRDVLVQSYGVSADRLRAEGIGYLAPRAANDSPEGQQRNRRVEAVLAAN